MLRKTQKVGETRIMIFGTFDGLHPGHLNFFKQAKKLGSKPYLVASIARDKNVFRIKKELPTLDENKRLLLIKKCKLINKVVLSGSKNHIPHILKEHPDIIALGYDQRNYIKNLKSDLKKAGLLVKIVRLEPYKENIYKNRLLKAKNHRGGNSSAV